MYKLLSSNIDDENYLSLSLEERYESEFTKTASRRDLPKEVDEAIRNMVRKKNHSYILVTSMGDGETWGSNNNGDYFPNEGLLGIQNTPVQGILAEKDERLAPDMRAKRRFETFNDAHFFKHHKNKIDRGDPHFGYVPAAIWNPKMRTVLLIIGVDRDKAPDTAAKIDANERVAVSMGAKLPWDRCSICGQRNKTTLKYCPHLKYEMKKILPDGRRVYAENLFPRFFDISEVTKPAFLAGLQLEKIAREGGANDPLDFSCDLASFYDIGRFDKLAESNSSSLMKHAVLYKKLPTHMEGTIARVCETEKDLPHTLLKDLAKLNPSEAWGTLTHAGIIAKPNEFAYILMKHEGREDLANQYLNKKAVLSQPKVKGLDDRLHGLADIDITHNAVKLSRSIPSHVIDDRSIGKVDHRIYETDKGLRKEAGVTGMVGMGSILSALYLLYRKNAEHKFSAYGLLGAGIGALMSDHPDHGTFIGNDPYAIEELNKQAGVAGMAARAGLGFAVPYMASAHIQNKMERGEQVGPIGKFVANNPGKLGLIGGLGAMNPKALYSGAKTVAADTAKGVKNLFTGK
jgi:hypothetical protein